MTQPILEINDLSISYFTRAGEAPAVRDFSLTINPGESVALVGESGCGKSTVAMGIMRYLGRNGRIISGSILFEGQDLLSFDDEALRLLRGGRIAMVYQEPFAALNPCMTIADQLAEVPMIHDEVSEEEALRRVKEILNSVNLPDPSRIMRSYPHQLSGGQQQRVVIAMALLSRPSLLLCDEPTTALDVTVEAGIIELIHQIQATLGTSVLFISHNLGLVREVCERVCVMYAGEVVEKGPIEQMFVNPQHPYTHGLFGCIPQPNKDKFTTPLTGIPGQLPLLTGLPEGCVFGPRCEYFKKDTCQKSGKIPLESLSAAHHVRCSRISEIDWNTQPQASATYEKISDPSTQVFTLEGVDKHYPIHDRSLRSLIKGKRKKWVKANQNISFEVNKGETVAIVGESGCGKSTLAKVIIGLETATNGSIQFMEEDITHLSVKERSVEQRSALQMIFQNPNDTLNPSISIGGQIMRVLRKFGIAKSDEEAQEKMSQLLSLVKLPQDFAYRKPRQLSGGQKQRIGIARAFAGNPAAIIADEPVSALDVSVQAAITTLLMEIQQENKTTLLFISHDLGLVHYIADRIVVMYLGQIMEWGTVEEVFSPPYHPYTEALLSAIPVADPTVAHKKILLEGALPSILKPPPGCPFASRCPRHRGSICDTTPPPIRVHKEGHEIACHIPLEELEQLEPVFYAAKTA